MTPDLRQALKLAIDQAVRATLPDDAACAGCGLSLTDPWTQEPAYLPGCRTCSDRRSKHRARARLASAQLELDLPRVTATGRRARPHRRVRAAA